VNASETLCEQLEKPLQTLAQTWQKEKVAGQFQFVVRNRGHFLASLPSALA